MGGFPDETLELTAQAAFGADLTGDPNTWTWTTLTCPHPTRPAQTISRVLNNPISIRKGVAVGATNQQTTSATITLLNNDGWLTPKLPTSPYAPHVDAGTPIRLQLRTQTTPLLTDTFTRTTTNGWGTSTNGITWTPATASPFSTNGSAGQIAFAAKNVSRTITANLTATNTDMVFDSTWSAMASGILNQIGVQFRRQNNGTTYLWCVTQFGTDGIVSLRVYARVNGVDTPLDIISSFATYTAGTLIRTRIQVQDEHVRIRAWVASGTEPADWDIDTVNTLVNGPGGIGMQAFVPNASTNTLPLTATVDNITVTQMPHDRLQGFVSDIRPTFQPQPDGTTWSTVTIDVGGVSSRLERKESPAYSPLRRSLQLASTQPIGYWPLEDAAGSTYGVSAFPAGPRMTVTGPAVFGFTAGEPEDVYLSRYGTKPLVSVAAGARLTAPVPLSAVEDQWAVSVTAEVYSPDVPGITELRIAEWRTSGTHQRWALVGTTTGYQVRAYNDTAGTVTNVVTVTDGPFISQVTYTVEAHQNGANIDVELLLESSGYGSASVAGTLGPVNTFTLNPDRVNTTNSVTPYGLRFVVGHVFVNEDITVRDLPYYYDPATGFLVRADDAWYKEAAHSRLDRLCAEERVPFRLVVDPGPVGATLLNAQGDGSFTDLVRAAADSESGGLLYEDRWGYAYLPRAGRYNQPARLTVDLNTYARDGGTDPGEVLVPQLDSREANYWTVERTGGGSGSYAAPLAYRQRRGTIAQQATLDVLYDADTDQHAAWRTNLAFNARDAFYPNLPLDLHANPDLIGDWLACEIGSRVQRTNQPSVAGIGPIDQVIDGYTETISPRTWSVTINASPGQVWDVAEVDDPVLGKADTDSSTVRAANSTASTLLVDVTAGPRWTIDPAQMPLQLILGTGEEVTATSVSGTSNPQTFTVTRGTNGFQLAVPAGTSISLSDPARCAL